MILKHCTTCLFVLVQMQHVSVIDFAFERTSVSRKQLSSTLESPMHCGITFTDTVLVA